MLPALVITVAGCSLEKRNWIDRNLQNLTAHYNILFNARETVRLKQIIYANAFIDNYNEILSVYPDTIPLGARAAIQNSSMFPQSGGTNTQSGGALPQSGGTNMQNANTIRPTGTSSPQSGGAYTQNAGPLPQNGGAYTPNAATLPQNGGANNPNAGTLPQNGGTNNPNAGSLSQNSGANTQNAGSLSQNGGANTQAVGSFFQNGGANTQNTGIAGQGSTSNTQGANADKDLDAAILRANTIISIKEQSRYLGDAYLVLGKAYYLEGKYFNSVEYFNYVTHSYQKRPDLIQDALIWKTRSLMYLNQMKQAKLPIDSAISNIPPPKAKHKIKAVTRLTPDVYATKLLYDINVKDYDDGEEMAKQAIHFCRNDQQRFRWTFILGQVQERNQKLGEADKNYISIINSNAPFEMAFNASLNQIRIEDLKKGKKLKRTDRLLALLKNPNNKEFKDQVYFHVANIYMDSAKVDTAIRFYNLSVRTSLKNRSQKGLSYLKLAEIYFNNKADYLRSKKYYDSTLTTLPTNYPGYAAIQRKAVNLKLLANQYEIINREDTLQALAAMDEKKRLSVIDKMVKDKMAAQKAVMETSVSPFGDTDPDAEGLPGANGNSRFYFYNVNAVTNGFSDFKQKWGNIKLDDNWRRSSRSITDVAVSAPVANPATNGNKVAEEAQKLKDKLTAQKYANEIIEVLPTTPSLRAKSNKLVYDAYFELAYIYRDLINDNKESAAMFRTIMDRFPNNPNRPVIYYSLYRLYSYFDEAQSNIYITKLLNEYPTSTYALFFKDANYLKKINDHDASVTEAYDEIFDLYYNKHYDEVVACVPEVLKRFPANKYSAQLYYLQAISAGHNEKLQPFADSLQNILKKFPKDRLIDPLINQHLIFINANRAQLLTLNVVLADDTAEIPFTLSPGLKKEANLRREIQPYIQPPQYVDQATPINPRNVNILQTKKGDGVKPPDQKVKKEKGAVSNLFSMRDSSNYFFVVNVSSGTAVLSSSRFGIGQFNRANFAGLGIKHQLMDVGDDTQLIYVGKFSSLTSVKEYAKGIIPLLPDIMKVPKDKYSFFVITQENLTKLLDKKTLDSYIDYYQNNY